MDFRAIWTGEDKVTDLASSVPSEIKQAVTVNVIESSLNWALLAAVFSSTFLKSKNVWLWGALGAFVGYQKAMLGGSLGSMSGGDPRLAQWTDSRIEQGQPCYGPQPVYRPAPMSLDVTPFEGEQ